MSMSLGARKLFELAHGPAWAIPTARGGRGEALLAPEHLLFAVTRDREGGACQRARLTITDDQTYDPIVAVAGSTAGAAAADQAPSLG
jgi:hypothetical protein